MLNRVKMLNDRFIPGIACCVGGDEHDSERIPCSYRGH